MLRIECPWCGVRDETEFHCGGQSHVTRPGPAEDVSDAAIGKPEAIASSKGIPKDS
ncbi:MAG: sarcosine oxidase subunit delta [Sphingomonadales bacterium]